MKLHLLYITLIAWILTLALTQPDYQAGYLDGYRQQQLEDLPAVGVENVKRANPWLLLKG